MHIGMYYLHEWRILFTRVVVYRHSLACRRSLASLLLTCSQPDRCLQRASLPSSRTGVLPRRRPLQRVPHHWHASADQVQSPLGTGKGEVAPLTCARDPQVAAWSMQALWQTQKRAMRVFVLELVGWLGLGIIRLHHEAGLHADVVTIT